MLDVGCGNNSPRFSKQVRPDIYYVGIDVGDYNQSAASATQADEYIIVTSGEFADRLAGLHGFDGIISNHNLEHCESPDKVVTSLARALNSGGRLYLAFPAAASTRFPSRSGTLNFFDDPTHTTPPSFEHVMKLLSDEGLAIEYARARQRNPLHAAVGLLLEPASRARRHVYPCTWALWGFESVIWARNCR